MERGMERGRGAGEERVIRDEERSVLGSCFETVMVLQGQTNLGWPPCQVQTVPYMYCIFIVQLKTRHNQHIVLLSFCVRLVYLASCCLQGGVVLVSQFLS